MLKIHRALAIVPNAKKHVILTLLAVSFCMTACTGGGTVSAAGPSAGQPPGVNVGQAVLPPMPDRVANNATLAGIDSTGTGVRDDIYRWVFQTYSSTRKRNALLQSAKAFRKIYSNPPQTTADALVIAKELHRAGSCFWSYKKAGYLTWQEALDLDRGIEVKHADTKARMQAYDAYNFLLDGTGGPLGPTAGSCDAGGGL